MAIIDDTSIEDRARDLSSFGRKTSTSAADIAKGGRSLLNQPDFGSLAATERRSVERSQLNQQVQLNRKKEAAIRRGYRSAMRRDDGAAAMQFLQMAGDLNPFGIKVAGEREAFAFGQIEKTRATLEEDNNEHPDKLALQEDMKTRLRNAPDAKTLREELLKLSEEASRHSEAGNVPSSDFRKTGTDLRSRLAEFAPLLNTGKKEDSGLLKQAAENLDIPLDRFGEVMREKAEETPLRSQVSSRIQTVLAANPELISSQQRRLVLNEVLGSVQPVPGQRAGSGSRVRLKADLEDVRDTYQVDTGAFAPLSDDHSRYGNFSGPGERFGNIERDRSLRRDSEAAQGTNVKSPEFHKLREHVQSKMAMGVAFGNKSGIRPQYAAAWLADVARLYEDYERYQASGFTGAPKPPTFKEFEKDSSAVKRWAAEMREWQRREISYR